MHHNNWFTGIQIKFGERMIGWNHLIYAMLTLAALPNISIRRNENRQVSRKLIHPFYHEQQESYEYL